MKTHTYHSVKYFLLLLLFSLYANNSQAAFVIHNYKVVNKVEKNIAQKNESSNKKTKKQLKKELLYSIFLGLFGVNNFLKKEKISGILKLLLLTCVIASIIAIAIFASSLLLSFAIIIFAFSITPLLVWWLFEIVEALINLLKFKN